MSTITITFEAEYCFGTTKEYTLCLSPIPEGQTPETLCGSVWMKYLCMYYANLHGCLVREVRMKSITAGGKHTPQATLAATFDISPGKYKPRKEFALKLSPIPEEETGISLWHSQDLNILCQCYARLSGIHIEGRARLLILDVDHKVFAFEEEDQTRRTIDISGELYAWIRELDGEQAADEAAAYAQLLPIGGEYEGTSWRVVRCS